jgi:hypothetical protein
MNEGRPDGETLALTSRACRQALAGFC